MMSVVGSGSPDSPPARNSTDAPAGTAVSSSSQSSRRNLARLSTYSITMSAGVLFLSLHLRPCTCCASRGRRAVDSAILARLPDYIRTSATIASRCATCFSVALAPSLASRACSPIAYTYRTARSGAASASIVAALARFDRHHAIAAARAVEGRHHTLVPDRAHAATGPRQHATRAAGHPQ